MNVIISFERSHRLKKYGIIKIGWQAQHTILHIYMHVYMACLWPSDTWMCHFTPLGSWSIVVSLSTQVEPFKLSWISHSLSHIGKIVSIFDDPLCALPSAAMIWLLFTSLTVNDSVINALEKNESFLHHLELNTILSVGLNIAVWKALCLFLDFSLAQHDCFACDRIMISFKKMNMEIYMLCILKALMTLTAMHINAAYCMVNTARMSCIFMSVCACTEIVCMSSST